MMLLRTALALLFYAGTALVHFSNQANAQSTESYCDSIVPAVKACPDPDPRDLLFLVDGSNSMNPNKFFREMLDYCLSLYCAFDADKPNQAGMIIFNADVRTVIPLAKYSRNEWFDRIEAIRATKGTSEAACCSCCTPLAEAFDQARLEFDVRGYNELKMAFTITDGVPSNNGPNTGGNPDWWFHSNSIGFNPAIYNMRIVPERANALKARGVRLFLVGVPDKDGNAPNQKYFSGGFPHNSNQCTTRNSKEFCARYYKPPFPVVSLPVEKNSFSTKSWNVQALITQVIDAMCEILPTAMPTTSPTHTPTKLPTYAPTFLPTRVPTVQPSNSPTTSRPSRSPTNSPTTSKPTESPSRSPTTSKPSRAPSFSPTTSRPSNAPTTSRPSHSPTASPTTSRPSKSPTTSKPSQSPTLSPSVSKPTVSPTTSRPTFSPTLSPSVSRPTVSPTTSRPSLSPSLAPTTSRPTLSPTTSAPSHAPTVSPTSSHPSRHPTRSPTSYPTSQAPTSSPSQTPSQTPTGTPSSVPTRKPTRRPTKYPTSKPTNRSPTRRPSQSPSAAPTPSPIETHIEQVDLTFLVDRSESMKWHDKVCKRVVDTAPVFTDEKATSQCWELFLRYILAQADALATIRAGAFQERALGWADDFAGTYRTTRGLRVNIIGFACTNKQRTPLSFFYSREIANGPITSRSQLIQVLEQLRTTVTPNGGTCPGQAIEVAVRQIESTDAREHPLQTVILLTDGVFYDGKHSKSAAGGLEVYKALRFAVGIAVATSKASYGLTQAEIKEQKKQLTSFVGEKNPNLFKDLGTDGWAALPTIARKIAEELPDYHFQGAPAARYSWCGFRRKSHCKLDSWRSNTCKWPDDKINEYGCKRKGKAG